MKGRAIPYLPQELDWIEARKEMPRAEMHAMFCAYWQRDDVSLKTLNGLCKRKGWLTGRTGCFQKGIVPHNKGRSLSPEAKAKALKTAFKPGNVPHTFKGAGHEFTCPKDGYVYLIIADDRARTKTKTRRVLKHKHLWEQDNGPLPKGMCLKCLDGDKTNCRPSNWEAIPRALLPRLAGVRVGIHYDSAPRELKPAILNIARLDHAAREARSNP